MDIVAQIRSLLEPHPAVRSVRLVGSRQQGTQVDLSDWDFEVATDDFEAVVKDLPTLVSPLSPLAQQWDRLGDYPTYMLMLRGPMKIDLLFLDQPLQQEAPWQVGPDTLQAIDDHFWDWLLWLAAKDSAGRDELVRDELAKMGSYLLRPMGSEKTPNSVESAVEQYMKARREAERRFDVVVSKAVGREVAGALRRSGYRC